MLCAKVGSKRNSTSKRAREQWCLSPCACHRALRSPLSRSHALWVVASILSAAQEEPNLAQGHLGLFGVSSFSAAVLLRMLLLVCRNWMTANAWCKRVGERAKARTFASRLHLPARAERGTRQVVPVGGAGPGISWTCPTTTKSAEALLSMGARSCSRIGSPPPDAPAAPHRAAADSRDGRRSAGAFAPAHGHYLRSATCGPAAAVAAMVQETVAHELRVCRNTSRTPVSSATVSWLREE